MKISYKNNFIGYFKFYYSVLGNRILYCLAMSILISFLDGIGIAMFIPLLQYASNAEAGAGGSESSSLGKLQYLTDFIQKAGFELNVTNILIVLTTLFVLKGLFKYIQLAYYARIRELFVKKIRYFLVDNLQGLSYNAFLKLDAGKIQNTFINEVTRLLQTMTYYFNASQAVSMLATYVFLALLANYQFALMVAVGSAISNFIYRRIYKKTKQASFDLAKQGSDFNSYLIQSINYFKYLKSTNTYSAYSKKLRSVINETSALNRKIGMLNAISTSIKEPIIICIVSLVIVIQLKWMGTGLDTIILSLLLFYRALTYLILIQSSWQKFIEFSGGMHSVAEMTRHMDAAQERFGDEKVNQIKEQIEFKDVLFYYDKKVALDHISLSIPAKQTIALIGESGSGKTTIANMIAGLFPPVQGQILIDGVPMNELDINLYRSKIGYISQESVIFNDSIYNNITFWAEPTSENLKKFNEVIEMASLREFIDGQPDKEHTNLGDNGILVSGGQKQRISIARELYKNAELLILDEATSALDSETEKMIQENIEKLHGSYTMVLIAHRLSTIKEADIIYLLENGKISASGSFYEMMNKSSRFKKMVSLQAV